MAVSFTDVLQTVYNALKSDEYEEKLGKVADYEITFCGLDAETNSWKVNLRYTVQGEVDLSHARFSIDAESGEIAALVSGQWDWHVLPASDLGLGGE